jgi:hypothetical protein
LNRAAAVQPAMYDVGFVDDAKAASRARSQDGFGFDRSTMDGSICSFLQIQITQNMQLT